MTLEYRSTSISWVTRTEPGRLTRADVVAPEVDEHDVLGALLLVGAQVGLQFRVLPGGVAARSRAGYRVGSDPAVLDLYQQLGGGADDLEAVQVQVVHVRGRVDGAQGAVYLEGVGGGRAAETLARTTVCITSPSYMYRLTASTIASYSGRDMFGRGRLAGRWAAAARGRRDGLFQPRGDVLNPARGLRVGAVHAQVEMGVADDPHPVRQMVEDDEGVRHHEDRPRAGPAGRNRGTAGARSS